MYLLLRAEKNIFVLVWSIACLVLIGFLWKLQNNLDRHKFSDEFKFRHDRTIHLELLQYLLLSAKETHILLCPDHSLRNFYSIFMKLAINRTCINYLTSWKLGHVALFKFGDPHLSTPLIAGMLGLRWAILAHWATLYLSYFFYFN